ncbi:RNF213 [Mytilus edulis]|uniref:RNF213 n=1 Tax=Mytilus edulis TaxID=6550 RepID=A0A8S3QEF1_MYTED|nr:RNF213 [Mytilus edulis]
MASSGCVLFSNFQVSFRCNKDSNVCIFITFGETKDKQCIRGVRDTIHADDSVIIRTVGKRLEKCYDEWLLYTNEQRDTNEVLNYFNMSQLVILQKELAKVGRNQTPCVLVYPLLFSLKQKCNVDDLKQAILSARQDLIDIEKQAELHSRSDAQKAERSLEDVFINIMKEANFSELLAKEALKTIPPNQTEDGITWCLANESEFVEPDLTENDFFWDGVNANGLIEVIQNLVGVWEKFLTSASSSFSDFLSLKHLALILKRLEEKEDITSFDVNGIEEGKPNLFVCLQDEMYNTVLAIYNAYYKDVLPSSDDVLLCSEKTTLDMLDIFWRRAFLTNDKKVRCLVNADLLRYEISDDGEKQMEVYMQRAQENGLKYKLIVICSSENEFKCRLVAALDNYRCPNLSIGGYQSVKDYVQRVLTKDTQRVRNPASAVDFDRSSVRVAKSYRAGVGKSFYARKMVNDLKERKQVPKTHLMTNIC